MEKYLEYIRSCFPFNNKLVYTEAYYNTVEINNLFLLNKKFFENQDKWFFCFQKIKTIFSKYKSFDTSFKYEGFFSRCYSCTIILNESNYSSLLLELSISFIGPYYHLVVFEFKKNGNNSWKGHPTLHYNFSKFDINNEVGDVFLLVEALFGVKIIPGDDIHLLIPGVYFESVETGKFSVYNAFFYDAFYLRI